MNYRIITISIIDGSLYDIAEFQNLSEADAWAIDKKLIRWDLHSICVAIEGSHAHVMGRIYE